MNLKDLDQSQIEGMAVDAIIEHRKLLAQVQNLHDKLTAAGKERTEALSLAYTDAVQAHDDQQMVVGMLIDVLGYVPKIAE
ncbi:transcriptional repressor TraM [Microvirga sp. W0021]|uniref:Transcriptional repressor TraM n=1 Tax=Hohaiivirga grylli TaxID=3133970 RepID=A0ABV0BJW8_9HYPH